jgi:hypothetical protein
VKKSADSSNRNWDIRPEKADLRMPAYFPQNRQAVQHAIDEMPAGTA